MPKSINYDLCVADFLTSRTDAAVLANISVFDNLDEETCRQIKLVRPSLLVILVVPNRNCNYLQAMRDSQCSLTLEEPVDYRKLAGTLKMDVG